MDRHRTHADPTDPLTGRAGARQRSKAWRLAADWVKLFSPVLYELWAEQARREIVDLRKASVKDRPFNPNKAISRREPHRTLLAEPLGNVAIPVKFERKRRGRPPKVRAGTKVRKNNKTSRKSSGSVDDGGRH